MKTAKQTPAQAIQEQHATILQAIEMLQAQADRMTSEVNPENPSWRDVCRFGQVVAAAQGAIDELQHC